jgi:hypothetical protein
MVEDVVLPCCSSLIALTYSILADVQNFITLRPFVVSRSANNCKKDEKLLYICPV